MKQRLREKLRALGRLNPKTTWAGAAVAVLQVAVVFGWLTVEQAAALTGVAVAFGLLAAKDGDK